MKFKILLMSGEPTSYYKEINTIEDLKSIQDYFGNAMMINFKPHKDYKCPTIMIYDDYRYD